MGTTVPTIKSPIKVSGYDFSALPKSIAKKLRT
jgi:hypothetical protein